MTVPYDLDEMIVSGEIEGDAVAAHKRLDIAARDRAFEYALLNDLEMMIQIAKASSKAAEKEAQTREEERAGLASADPDKVARVRVLVRQRTKRRADALALTMKDNRA